MENNGRRKKFSSKRRNSIKRNVHTSKRIGVGEERYSSGIGFIVIPSDKDRDSYIKFVYQTSTAMIINTTGELIKDVLIPVHILRDIEFPEGLDERGSMVSWNNIPLLNQVIINGVINSPKESYPYREWEKVHSIEGGDYGNVINKSWDIKHAYARIESYFGDSDALSEDSGIENIARSPKFQSKVKLLCNGKALIYGDTESKILSEEEVTIEVGTQEGEVSTLKINVDGTFIYKDRYENEINIDGANGEMTIKPKNGLVLDADNEIKAGENATEAAMLGNKTTSLIGEILDAIKLITVPTAMGPSGTPVNFATFDAIKAKLNTLVSSLVKIE